MVTQKIFDLPINFLQYLKNTNQVENDPNEEWIFFCPTYFYTTKAWKNTATHDRRYIWLDSSFIGFYFPRSATANGSTLGQVVTFNWISDKLLTKHVLLKILQDQS